MTNFEPSDCYKAFFNYVLGDIRYYHCGGLSEDIFLCLEGPEREKAESLVLRDVKKIFVDERTIRAAGYLRLHAAMPLLEKRLSILSFLMRRSIRSATIWTLLKIKADKAKLGSLIEVVNGKGKIKNLTRVDAIELLSDFREEPLVVDTLLTAFLERDFMIYMSAQHSLRKIFKDNQVISDLFELHQSAHDYHIRTSISRRIELFGDK